MKLFHLALSLEFMHGVRVLQYLEEIFIGWKFDIADCREDEAITLYLASSKKNSIIGPWDVTAGGIYNVKQPQHDVYCSWSS